MMIDCDACAARGPACGDCVVSVLLGFPPVHRPGSLEPLIDLDGEEQAAIAVLAGSGLIPPLRLVPGQIGTADLTRSMAQGRRETPPTTAAEDNSHAGRCAAG